MERIHLTVVIKSLGLGGAERLVVDSLPYLDRERFNYHFSYITPWKSTLVPSIADAGFAVTCLGRGVAAQSEINGTNGGSAYAPARSLRALGLLPSALAHLMQLMQRTQCHLLQADLPASGIIARVAGRRMHVPVAYTEHNLQERYHPVTRAMNRVTYGWNDIVHAVSDEVAVSIRRNGLESRTDVRIIPNGVPVETIQSEARCVQDLRDELNLPAGRPIVGTVAVFRPQKRLLDWLAVAHNVAAMSEDVQFLMVGDGPDMPLVRRRIKELGLGDRVRLTGFREDGRRLTNLIDVFLMTSEFEGLPMAMLEAMALGKPIVATAVGGIPEVISPGKQGFLAELGDTDLLAVQTFALLTNPTAASEMGRRGASDVMNYHHTRGRVKAIESGYLEILGR